MKAIFSCLNLKPDDGFLPYNIPELFNKTGHGQTDIAPRVFLGIIVHTSSVCESGTEGPPSWLRPVSKKTFLRV